jgi:fatty-acyl-CoA synthase/long-chain acyl-CoA synthetase
MDMTAGDALRRAATLEPQRTALVEVMPAGLASLTGAESTDRRWSYAELLDQAEECAHWLLQRYAPGERICLWAPNVAEWVILQYGAALAGLVLVTANPALRAGELRYVLQQSKAVGLFHVAEFRGTDTGAIAEEVAAEVRETFCLSRWQTEVRGYPRHGRLPQVSPRDPAQVQYTSGTTGHPKGALLHHMGLVTNGSFVAARMGLDKGVVVSPMPLFHTAGSVLGALGCVTTCSTYVLPLFFEPEMVMAAVQREKANVLFGVPTMLIAMLEHPKRAQTDFSSLEVAISGGAPVPSELLNRIEAGFGCDLLTVYGQTESSPIICQTARSDSVEDKSETAGQPLWQVEVRVVNPTDGEVVAVGTEGEIQARGYQCMLGYFNMPEATAQAMSSDGWLRTGDLGTMDNRGYVRVTGRLKDMIIRGGENMYPVEIESTLIKHPAVVNVAVFGLPDPMWGEVVCAAIQVRDQQQPPTAAELQAHCRLEMAPQKSPARYYVCPAFPLTGSGKVQKFRLREMATAGELPMLF